MVDKGKSEMGRPDMKPGSMKTISDRLKLELMRGQQVKQGKPPKMTAVWK